MDNKDMECRDNQVIIPNRDHMDLRVVIMMIDEEGVVSWRRCWLVWLAVVVWMLVCCFKSWENYDNGLEGQYYGYTVKREPGGNNDFWD